MTFECNYKEDQKIYMANDNEQVEYRLNRVTFDFHGRLFLEIVGPDGAMMEVPAVFTRKSKDILRTFNAASSKDDVEDDGGVNK